MCISKAIADNQDISDNENYSYFVTYTNITFNV